WHPQHESVTIEMVLKNLRKNIENAKRLLSLVIRNIPKQRRCSCKDALKYAIVTRANLIPDKVKKDLDIIIGKYIRG
ncbi:MAG: S-methyl-5'-thioadenosine phosphorylase, partial [Candidatus Omnitrophica bacterium]|nr:S-methyl-5'-thioadenosine phosphorylase [Candidatus Omnitrophota bacterium]